MMNEKDILELNFLSKEMIDNLSDKEKEVIKNKLGTDLDNTQAFKAVKTQFKESRKRILEIEEKSLKILGKGGAGGPGKA